MNNAKNLYYEIGESISDAKVGNMFGWECFKYQNKPFIYFDKNSEQAIVFKLDKDSLTDALGLQGAEIFNPGDKGKPMKNWAVIPFIHSNRWKELSLKSYQNIVKEVKNGKR